MMAGWDCHEPEVEDDWMALVEGVGVASRWSRSGDVQEGLTRERMSHSEHCQSDKYAEELGGAVLDCESSRVRE